MSARLGKAWSGVVCVWAAWIPLAVALIVANPQNVPGWSAPVILFGWWPAAFALGWRLHFVRL